MKTIFNDILKSKTEWLAFGGTGNVPKVLPYFIPGWHLKRKKLGIKVRAIFYESNEGRKRGKEFIKMGLSKVRYIKQEFSLPATIYVYSNKIAIVLMSKEKPYGILIENTNISKSFKTYFELIWKVSKP